jgi:hypothetical protein
LISSTRTQVYVIGNPSCNTVKIGVSDTPHQRVKSIQLMSPLLLQVLWTCPGGRRLEKALHAHFAQYHSHGEWFTFPDQPVRRVREAVTGGVPDPAPKRVATSYHRPERDPKEVRMTPSRALYVAVSEWYGSLPFSTEGVADVFGIPQGTVRSQLERLRSEGLVVQAGTEESRHSGVLRKRYVVVPLAQGRFIGRPSYGASVPTPRLRKRQDS